ncbi:DUF4365 domain-containing protein [bacterium]|nr:DUF4365 domain-containing protein [bacterium]
MSITENHQKEALSIAYVEAISARAGVNIAFAARHDYGIDGSFRPVVIVGNQRCETGHHLNFQLKATTRWTVEGDHVLYPMEVRTYNHLVRIASELGACPTVLLLLCLPDGPDNWLSHSSDQLILRRCCYYLRLQGSESSNTDNVTVRIPTHQHLSPESLLSLVEQMRLGKLT